jgi:hypothetical protein
VVITVGARKRRRAKKSSLFYSGIINARDQSAVVSAVFDLIRGMFFINSNGQYQ